MLYHVTDKETGKKIWENGELCSFENIQFNNRSRTKRKKMRNEIRAKASERYSNWVSRSESIFTWTTFERAQRYAKNVHKPAIVDVGIKKDTTAWCVENWIVEHMYTEYCEKSENELLIQMIEEAREWGGQQSEEIEVWFRPGNVSRVNRVIDDFGNPINY